MGDGEKASLRLQFNPKVRLAFHGAMGSIPLSLCDRTEDSRSTNCSLISRMSINLAGYDDFGPLLANRIECAG